MPRSSRSWPARVFLASVGVCVLGFAASARGEDPPPPPRNPLAPPDGGTTSSPLPKPGEKEAREAAEFQKRMEEALKAHAAPASEKPMYDSAASLVEIVQRINQRRPPDDESENFARVLAENGILEAQHLARQRLETSALVTQDFLATAAQLTSIGLWTDDEKGATVRVIDLARDARVAETPFAPERRWGKREARFDPPVPLRPGEFYRIEIARTPDSTKTPLRCYLSEYDAIPFAHCAYRDGTGALLAPEAPRQSYDLALQIRGRELAVPVIAPARAKRALVVLLDRAGLVDQVAGLEHVAVVVYLGRDVRNPLVLAKSRGDTLEFLLQLSSQALSALAVQANPLPAPWNTQTYGDFEDAPREYVQAVRENQRQIERFVLAMHGPERWREESRALSDLAAAERERIGDAFSADAIRAQLGTRFDKVVVLEGAAFSAEKLLRTLADLAPEYRIDLHVLAGGSVDGILLPRHAADAAHRIDEENFLLPLWRARVRGDLRLHMSTVYSVASFGSRLGWWTLGAERVLGMHNEDYLPHRYLDFLRTWLESDAKPEAAEDAEAVARASARAFASQRSPFAAEHSELFDR